MKRNVAVIMVGAIGSGKSTVSKIIAEQNNLIHLDPDVHWKRNEPYSWNRACENWALTIAGEYKCVKMGRSFLLDTSSRLRRIRREAVRVIRGWSQGKPNDDFDVIAVYVNTDLKTCLIRNSERQYKQSDDRVREYWNAIDQIGPDCMYEGFDRVFIIDNNPLDVTDDYGYIKSQCTNIYDAINEMRSR